MLKKLITLFLLVIFLGFSSYAEDLFQEDARKSLVVTKQVSVVAQPSVQGVSPQESTTSTWDPRHYSITIEPLLARGDVQFGYEMPSTDSSDIAWMLMAHVNPHTKHQEETGKFGIYAGARMYLEETRLGPFVQLLGGFNYEKNDAFKPSASLNLGYKLQIKPKLYTELGFVFARSYSENRDGAKTYLLLSLGLEINHRLPFF